MSELTRYQDGQQEPPRQVRRELAKSQARVTYITGSTLAVQESIGGIQTKGGCLMIQAAASSQALIKAAELQGVSPECLEILMQRQIKSLLLMSRAADVGSGQLLQLIEELPALPPQSLLDWLDRFLNDYRE